MLVSPNLILGSLVVAEPIAYPLVLTAVYAAIVALERLRAAPSSRSSALVGLAAFARVQYVLLVPVLIVAALVVERGRLPSRSCQSFGLATLVFAVLGVVGVASGPHRVLGAYDVGVQPARARRDVRAISSAIHALLVPFAAGIVLVPGATRGTRARAACVPRREPRAPSPRSPSSSPSA